MNTTGMDFNGELFDLIYNNTSSCVAIFEYIQGDFVFKNVNNAFENVEKIDKKSILGQKLKNKFPIVGDIGLYELLNKAYVTSVSQHCPRCLYESDTVSSWRKYDVFKLSTGELVVIYNEKMLNDISEYDLSNIQAKLESIYESSNIGIAFTDTNGNLLTSNNSWSELIGYSIDELAGLHFSELTYEDDLKREKILFDNLKRGFVSEYRLDKRVLTKNGYVKWIDLSVSAIKNSCGEIVNFVGVAVDITKQKNTNIELQEQKKFLTELIENAGSMIYVKDLEGRYKIVNKKFEMCTGYQRD
ncbi:MAG: PAS domain S-box protein, partial [Arcobacteraceae bacterium]